MRSLPTLPVGDVVGQDAVHLLHVAAVGEARLGRTTAANGANGSATFAATIPLLAT